MGRAVMRRAGVWLRVAVGVAAGLAATGDAQAHTAPAPAPAKPAAFDYPNALHQPPFGNPGWTWAPGPRPLMPHRLGDLRQAAGGLRLITSPRWHRPQFDMALGAQVPFLRWVSEGAAPWALEFETFVGMFMRTDIEHDTDVIGTDGYFGLPIVAAHRNWVFKLEFGHVSSHLGDETILSTGRRPINYSKEEIVPGVTWLGPYGFRVYTELAWAVRMGIEQGPHREKPWRWQWGFDWIGELWGFEFMGGWDFESRQEVGWNITSHVEMGVVIAGKRQTGSVRLVFGWLVGKSVLKQNHDKKSQWWSIGITGDL